MTANLGLRLPEADRSCMWMMSGLRNSGKHCGCGGFIHAGCEDIRARRGHASEDLCGLCGRFSGSIDHLRQSRTQGAMMVDARMTDVLEGKIGKTGARIFGTEIATFDCGQQFKKTVPIHMQS
jgi:hypothetical protein